jgi:GNAT superfamily N-acetyltransferase
MTVAEGTRGSGFKGLFNRHNPSSPAEIYVVGERAVASVQASVIWTERETTDLVQMPASLRYAALHNEVLQGGATNRGASAVPYHKTIDGIPQTLLVRHQAGDYGIGKRFALDLGTFDEKGKFTSKGWIDFVTSSVVHVLDGDFSKEPKAKIGKVHPQYLHPVFTSKVHVDRNNLSSRDLRHFSDQNGFYTAPSYRGRGINVSLFSAARIILKQEGIQRLYIEEDQIEGFSSNSAEVMARNLGARLIWVPDSPDSMTSSQRLKSLVAVIPTAPSERYPYRFI